MDPIGPILTQHGIVILDGALATELERRGCDLRDPLWSARVLLEQPEMIRKLHYDYFAAGADCATTASYQATLPGLARRGLDAGEAAAVIRRSVELAREARDQFWADPRAHHARPRPFVAASVGPYGAYLADGSEYRGDYGLSLAELMNFHRPRMRILLEAAPDILAFETIPCAREAEALVSLLAELPQATAWLSFTARDGRSLRSGESFAEAVRNFAATPQVLAVGMNCTSPEFVSPLIRAAREVTDKPILAYPNSGEGFDPSTREWIGTPSCGSFAAAAREWYAAGARLIGGCCRTRPEDIGAIADWAKAERRFARG